MLYKILPYTLEKARRHGLEVLPSLNKRKKIDVFRNGKRLASVGAAGYYDYPTFVSKFGKVFADEKRRLYKLRHWRDLRRGNGYYANLLLW